MLYVLHCCFTIQQVYYGVFLDYKSRAKKNAMHLFLKDIQRVVNGKQEGVWLFCIYHNSDFFIKYNSMILSHHKISKMQNSCFNHRYLYQF